MIDSAKIVGAFWIAKFMWNNKIFIVKFPYLKNSNCQIKVVLGFFSIVENDEEVTKF